MRILQKDIQDELVEEEQKNDTSDQKVQRDMEKAKGKKVFLRVTGDETNQNPPICMLYFPRGQFGPDAHYQRINKNT